MSKDKSKWLSKVLMMTIITGILVFSSNYAQAATDKTKPKITVTTNTEEPTSGKMKIELSVKDTSGISLVKWAGTSQKVSYFKEAGKTLILPSNNKKSIYVSKNGVYTFYAMDKAGNENTAQITIKNIDSTSPTVSIKKSTSQMTSKSVQLSLSLEDKGLGITSVKYLIGKKYESNFNHAGKAIKFTNIKTVNNKLNNNRYTYTAKLTLKTNNTITFLIEDQAGNRTLKRVYVTNIDKELPTIVIKPNTTKPTNKEVTIYIAADDAGTGVKEVAYLAGKKEVSDFTIDNNASIKPTAIKLSGENKGNFKTSKNGTYTVLVTDNVGNQLLKTIKISNIDVTLPTIALKDSVINQKATITCQTSDTGSGISKVLYLKGKHTDINSEKWDSKGTDITKTNKFTVKSAGNYSVLVQDLAGNKKIKTISIELEFKAVWISYLEFASIAHHGLTEDQFSKKIDTMFDNVVDMNMNAVVVQVRPFGDAMYPSSYFPWSRYISGIQGIDPGFDPLEYMVEAAHERGLEFHAWLNPYRVTTANTNYSKLSPDNPARIWYEDDNKENDRNVLSFDGNLYYNPASKQVQTLITNGIKEIVKNYDVDGIHFDDYFYPVLGNQYETNFDSVEYKAYVQTSKANNKVVLSIADWRRSNVNTLVKGIYKSIKNIDSSVQFGISPGGFINDLFTDKGYYVDIKTWLSSSDYIDYICPQIYWSFSHSVYPFAATVDKWLSYRTSSTVKMYLGIATYKAGSSIEAEWKKADILKKQIEYGRDTGLVDGFVFFRYDFFYNKVTKPAIDKLLEIM